MVWRGTIFPLYAGICLLIDAPWHILPISLNTTIAQFILLNN
jgi:hypothetical protein